MVTLFTYISFINFFVLVTTTSYTNASCPGVSNGTATLTVTFGPSNMLYSWRNSAGSIISNSATVKNLASGTYTVYLNDTDSADNCDAQRVVVIGDNSLYGAYVTTTPFNCAIAKGSASATPNGGANGITYKWFNGSTQIGTGSSISGLNIGNYVVNVSDSCGSVASTPFTIVTAGCCGDGICQSNEACGATPCKADCGVCCPAGTINANGSCQVCPPGSNNAGNGATTCTPCPANTYNSGGSDPCSPCPANTHSSAGAGVCTRCPSGQVRSVNGTACGSCPGGTYAPCDASPCTDCPAGSATPSSGYTFCTTCSAGTFAASGDTTCTSCPVNTYSNPGAGSCTPCPTGTSTSGSIGATHVLVCQ